MMKAENRAKRPLIIPRNGPSAQNYVKAVVLCSSQIGSLCLTYFHINSSG